MGRRAMKLVWLSMRWQCWIWESFRNGCSRCAGRSRATEAAQTRSRAAQNSFSFRFLGKMRPPRCGRDSLALVGLITEVEVQIPPATILAMLTKIPPGAATSFFRAASSRAAVSAPLCCHLRERCHSQWRAAIPVMILEAKQPTRWKHTTPMRGVIEETDLPCRCRDAPSAARTSAASARHLTTMQRISITTAGWTWPPALQHSSRILRDGGAWSSCTPEQCRLPPGRIHDNRVGGWGDATKCRTHCSWTLRVHCAIIARALPAAMAGDPHSRFRSRRPPHHPGLACALAACGGRALRPPARPRGAHDGAGQRLV